MRRTVLFALATLLLGPNPHPAARLSVVTPDGPRVLWQADQPQSRWSQVDQARLGTIHWRSGGIGLEWAELELSGAGEARYTRLIVARLDPSKLRLELQNGVAPGGFLNAWTVDLAPSDAVMAVNAGQFETVGAWGLVVHEGTIYRPARRGPLAGTVVVDRAGRLHLLNDTESLNLDTASALEAFQSYPLLLDGDGEIPSPLLSSTSPMDHGHRDARLAVGETRDGRLVVALTRFDGLGGVLGQIPFGLTVNEMAAVMGSLGCRRALALDGGISSQLLLRDSAGVRHAWPGLRPVPLGLTATPRFVGSRTRFELTP